MTSENIDWKKCIGVCSDGACAMTGKHGGVFVKIKGGGPETKFVHCSIHSEALASKKINANLKTVLNESVNKSRATN